MTDETLNAGISLQAKIVGLDEMLRKVQDGAFFIELHRSKALPRSESLIATVGTGSLCEHELAPLAIAFQEAVIAHYQAEIHRAKSSYAAL